MVVEQLFARLLCGATSLRLDIHFSCFAMDHSENAVRRRALPSPSRNTPCTLLTQLQFVSQLPQPTRGPSPEKSLVEMSSSANNTRNAGAMLPPASVRKHALSSRMSLSGSYVMFLTVCDQFLSQYRRGGHWWKLRENQSRKLPPHHLRPGQSLLQSEQQQTQVQAETHHSLPLYRLHRIPPLRETPPTVLSQRVWGQVDARSRFKASVDQRAPLRIIEWDQEQTWQGQQHHWEPTMNHRRVPNPRVCQYPWPLSKNLCVRAR